MINREVVIFTPYGTRVRLRPLRFYEQYDLYELAEAQAQEAGGQFRQRAFVLWDRADQAVHLTWRSRVSHRLNAKVRCG